MHLHPVHRRDQEGAKELSELIAALKLGDDALSAADYVELPSEQQVWQPDVVLTDRSL